MNIQARPPVSHQSWDEVRTRLDQNGPFSNMYDTPYYRDAVYDQFSKQEYARRHDALRAKMREHKLDCVIVPGGPSHWSFGGGMQWLTGHWEWHALCFLRRDAARSASRRSSSPWAAPTPKRAGGNAPMRSPTCATAATANMPK